VGDEQAGRDVAVVDPLVGQLVDGRYRVRELIAAGGMAKVYRADDERLDRRVALKIINGDDVNSPRFAEDFANEAKTIARLSHPNVVAVFDQGDHEGLPYVVMEFVSGSTLRDVLNERGHLEVAEAIELFDQVLAGLAAAHRIGLVHRDVKPENILITSRDGGSGVKVADFGLAHAVQTGRGSTDTGPILATAAYVPPEVLTGGPVTTRCDVYSAGILLFEMLTGAVPFDDADPMAVAWMHVERHVPHPSATRPEIPDSVDAVVKQCTRRHPGQRPPDALSVGRLLRGCGVGVSGISARPRPPDRASRNRLWNLPRPRLGSLIQLTVVAVVLALISAGGWWLADGRYTQAPSLLSQDAAQVAGIAADHGMSVTFAKASFSESVPKSMVLGQEPGPGERIHRNGVITVTVSKGPERYEVPDLVGQTLSAADRMLTDITLVTEVSERRWDARSSRDTVISVDPAPGESMRRGGVVRLVISDGPAPATVPELVGLSEAKARRLVEAQGLAFTVNKKPSDTVPKGDVVSQNLAAGTGVAKKTTVEVTVSQGPAPVKIPEVTGLTVAEAKKVLTEAGLEADVRMDLAGGDGKVFKQNPEAGESRPRGSQVAVYTRLGLLSVDSATGGLFDEGLQVERFTDLLDEVQLRLQVVDVFFLIGEDRLEDVGRGDVADRTHVLDAASQPIDRLLFDLRVADELFGHGLSDPKCEQALIVGQGLEEEDAVGEHFGVPHLVYRFGASVLGQLGVAPVLLHLGVQEVLVDGGELGGELLVKELDDAFVALHGMSLRIE